MKEKIIKAISHLDSLRTYCKEAKELENEEFSLWSEDVEAIDLAIEVLEKELSEKEEGGRKNSK